jgi:hypothetical protein
VVALTPEPGGKRGRDREGRGQHQRVAVAGSGQGHGQHVARWRDAHHGHAGGKAGRHRSVDRLGQHPHGAPR